MSIQPIDLVPATLRATGAPDGVQQIGNARIFATAEGALKVWVAGPNNKGVRLALEATAESIVPLGYKRFQVVLTDGRTFEVHKLGRCACGSPLAKFNPRTWTP